MEIDNKTMELWEDRISKNQCPSCGKPLEPALESVIFGTDEWDGHSYKPTCNCIDDENVRISIG
jgi:hypothetical protein